MSFPECRCTGLLADICREKREKLVMGTDDGYDRGYPFCAFANNDAWIYFDEIPNVLKYRTPQELLDDLRDGRNNFRTLTGCANRSHMLEVIQQRIEIITNYPTGQ